MIDEKEELSSGEVELASDPAAQDEHSDQVTTEGEGENEQVVTETSFNILTYDDFNIPAASMVGLGSAAVCLMMSIGVGAVLRLLRASK